MRQNQQNKPHAFIPIKPFPGIIDPPLHLDVYLGIDHLNYLNMRSFAVWFSALS